MTKTIQELFEICVDGTVTDRAHGMVLEIAKAITGPAEIRWAKAQRGKSVWFDDALCASLRYVGRDASAPLKVKIRIPAALAAPMDIRGVFKACGMFDEFIAGAAMKELQNKIEESWVLHSALCDEFEEVIPTTSGPYSIPKGKETWAIDYAARRAAAYGWLWRNVTAADYQHRASVACLGTIHRDHVRRLLRNVDTRRWAASVKGKSQTFDNMIW